MKTLFTLIIGLGLICSSYAAQTNEPSPTSAPMFTRALHLDTSVLSQVRILVPPKADESSQELLLRYFKTQQIEFKKPASLKFDEASGRLTVRTTEIDLDKMERIISKLEEKQ